jgi:hypothetical protein
MHREKYSNHSGVPLSAFKYDPRTTRLLKPGDLVLIAVPDDWQILQQVDPKLNGRTATVIEIVNEDEALVELQNSNKRPRARVFDEMIVAGDKSLMRLQLEEPKRIYIPKFCLCLQENILDSRLTEYEDRFQEGDSIIRLCTT